MGLPAGIRTELTSSVLFAGPANRYNEATNAAVHANWDKSPAYKPSNPHAELGNHCFRLHVAKAPPRLIKQIPEHFPAPFPRAVPASPTPQPRTCFQPPALQLQIPASSTQNLATSQLQPPRTQVLWGKPLLEVGPAACAPQPLLKVPYKPTRNIHSSGNTQAPQSKLAKVGAGATNSVPREKELRGSGVSPGL